MLWPATFPGQNISSFVFKCALNVPLENPENQQGLQLNVNSISLISLSECGQTVSYAAFTVNDPDCVWL